MKSSEVAATVAVLPKKTETKGFHVTWKYFAPIMVAIVIAFIPAPAGLPQHAWYYLALFVGVIVGLMLEPSPGGAIGVIGVTIVTLLARWVLYGPADLAKPGFNPTNAAASWALSGFSNATVWLIFAAFMFALGYEKTGLGRRIAFALVKRMGRKTLTLGYAVAVADTIMAPFTPSNTARSGGIIYPIIKNLPLLYDSKPNDPSSRGLVRISCGWPSPPPALPVRCFSPGLRPISWRRSWSRRRPTLNLNGALVHRSCACGYFIAGDGAFAHLLALSPGNQARRRGDGVGGERSWISWVASPLMKSRWCACYSRAGPVDFWRPLR